MTLISWLPVLTIVGGILVYTATKTLLFPKLQTNDPETKSQKN